MHSPAVNIIILNYKNWQDSRDCISSLLKTVYLNFSIFLADNHSNNNSIEYLVSWFEDWKAAETGMTDIPHRVTTASALAEEDLADSDGRKIWFVQNGRNEGFAAGINAVLRHLTGGDSYIWLLNPDMTVEPDALPQLVRYADQSPVNAIIGTEVRSETDKDRILFIGGGKVNFFSGTVSMVKTTNQVADMDYICGGSLFTHSRNFRRLGLLPEEYFLYWEETDWCYHARQKGHPLLVCVTAVCYDKVSTVIGKNYLSDYYYVRNGLRFVEKYRPGRVRFVLLFNALRWVKRIVTGKRDRARGVYKGTKDFLKQRRE